MKIADRNNAIVDAITGLGGKALRTQIFEKIMLEDKDFNRGKLQRGLIDVVHLGLVKHPVLRSWYYLPGFETSMLVLPKKPACEGLMKHEFTGPRGDCIYCRRTWDEVKSEFNLP